MKFRKYEYAPQKNTRNAAVFSAVCLIASAVSMMVSSLGRISMILQLIAFFSAVLGILVLVRFVLLKYVYILDGVNFIALKIDKSGKSSQLCNINLETAVAVAEKNKKFAEIEQEYGKIAIRMNFCQNLFPENFFTYIFEFNGKKSALTFEADDNFIIQMRVRIDYAKSLIETGFGDSENSYGNYEEM
jgi:hypothetical protein